MDNDKYTRAVELFNACISAGKDHIEANLCFDSLMEHLHANFIVPESTKANWDECRRVLKKEVSTQDILCIPPKVSDAVYPIALARSPMTEYQLPFIASKLLQMDEFHNRYGRLIIESMTQ